MKGECVFYLKYCFWTKFKANSLCLHFSSKILLKKKIIKICSSLTWRQSKKCKICVISKMNICLQLPFEKQPCRNASKINPSLEAAIKMHFSISLFCTLVKFFEKFLWWREIFSKFACNAVQLWTTLAEKLYFITALINALNYNFCITPLESCFCVEKQLFADVLENRCS